MEISIGRDSDEWTEDMLNRIERRRGRSSLAMLFAMEVVGTSAKLGEPLGLRFLVAGAIRIMPDGVVIYEQDKFVELMEETVAGPLLVKLTAEAKMPLVVQQGISRKWWVIRNDLGASEPIGPFDTKEEAEEASRK